MSESLIMGSTYLKYDLLLFLCKLRLSIVVHSYDRYPIIKPTSINIFAWGHIIYYI